MKKVLSVVLLIGLLAFTVFAAGVFFVQEKKVSQEQAPSQEQTLSQEQEEEQEKADDTKTTVKESEPDKKQEQVKEQPKEQEKADDIQTPVKENEPEESADFDATLINMFDPAKDMYVRSDVNVRKGPSTKYDLVGHLSPGALVKVIGQYGEKGWYYIEYEQQNAFVSNNFLQSDKPADEPAPVQKDEAKQPAAAASAAPVEAPKQAVQTEVKQAAQETLPEPASVLFIGDSRCVQMRAAVSDGGCSWICQNSKGYEWLESTALAQADRIIGKGTKVVICLGVNDTGNVNRYASLVNQKAAEWAGRGAKTYYVSVNPVTENIYRTEEEVQYFNATLPGLLSGVTWIDTHTYLVEHGFQMKDGLHYTDPSSVTIFNLIISSL